MLYKSLIFTTLLLSFQQSPKKMEQIDHQFSESTYVPFYEEYCYMEEGFLKIYDICNDSMSVKIEVNNSSHFSGGLDCRAVINGSHDASFREDHGEGEETAIFEFRLSPNKEYIFVKYEGPGLMYNGMGICLDGYFILDQK